MTYKPSKQGQADLVIGLLSEFISTSVHAGLKVSKFSGYDLSFANLVNTHTDRHRQTQKACDWLYY